MIINISYSRISVEVFFQMVKETIYFGLVVIFNYFDQSVVFLCPFYIGLKTGYLSYFVSEFQLGKL